MFFVIPEMPSKTIVMLYKKLPDHFKLPWDLPLKAAHASPTIEMQKDGHTDQRLGSEIN